MKYPPFFDEVKTITLHDPLAEFLGAAERGLIEYSYLEAVKLAGHSCPTVAGAYLMTLKALEHLYGGEVAERGAIRVEFRDDIADGVTGVMANVVAWITGATQDNGFKGIGGRFDRRNLLFFNVPINGEIRFTRVDTGASVETSYSAAGVPPVADMQPLMQRLLAGAATAEDARDFGELWQVRVKRILIDNFDNPDVIVLSKPRT